MIIYITKGFHTNRVHSKVPGFHINGVHSKVPGFYTKRGTNTKYRVFNYKKGYRYKVPGFIQKGVQIQSTRFSYKWGTIQSTGFYTKRGTDTKYQVHIK